MYSSSEPQAGRKTSTKYAASMLHIRVYHYIMTYMYCTSPEPLWIPRGIFIARQLSAILEFLVHKSIKTQVY